MTRSMVALAVAVAFSTPGLAEEEASTGSAKGVPLMVSFTDLKWTELAERKGMQFAVLTGNPGSGAYTQLRKVPPGTSNPLHRHSSELTNVVISGVWYTGADDSSARDFGPGSVVVMPADWPHVSGCRAGSECVFYQEGEGRFDYKPAAESNAGR